MAKNTQATQTAAQAANEALQAAHDAAEARLMKLTQDAKVQDSEVQALMEKLSDAEKALAETERQKTQTESVVDKLSGRLNDPLAVLDGSPSEILALVENDPSYSGVDIARLKQIIDEWTARKISIQMGSVAQTRFVTVSRLWLAYRRDRGEILDHEILATEPQEAGQYHNATWGVTTPAYRFNADERLKLLRRKHGLAELPEVTKEPLVVEPDDVEILRNLSALGFTTVNDLERISPDDEEAIRIKLPGWWAQIERWREQNAVAV